MAIPTVVGTSTQEAGAASLTITLPTGWAENDVIFVFIATATGQAIPATEKAMIRHAESGWTQMTGSPQTVTGGSRLYGFWRRMVAGDTAPITGDSGEYQAFNAICVRGAIATGTPFEALAFGSETTSDTSLSIPSITTLGIDRLIIGACSTGADSLSAQFSEWIHANLDPVSGGEQGDVCSNAGGGGGVASFAAGKATTGETGATTATLAEASPKAYLHLAVIPSAAKLEGKVTVEGAGTLAPAGQRTAIGKTSLAGTGSLSPTGQRTALGKVTTTGTGSLSAAGLRSTATSASISGQGSLAILGALVALSAGEITGTGTLSPVGLRTAYTTAVIAGQSTVSAVGEIFPDWTYFGADEWDYDGNPTWTYDGG